jgi:ABC-2 type transport system permease protein
VRLFGHELRFEQRLFWRNREAAFFTFFLPVIFFLIFGSVYGNDRIDGVKGAAYLVAGMIGYGVASTAFAGLGITMVVRRESGVLKRVRGTPMPPATYLSAVLASTLVVFMVEAGLIIALGRILYGVALPDHWLSLVLTLLLGAFVFAAMGLAITGLVHSSEGSSAVINAIYLPMAIISGTFFSPHSYPGFLKGIAEVLPLTHFTRLARDVMLQHEQIWSRLGQVGIVALWGLGALAVAVRAFRWEPHDR